jgi:NAD(P)H-dependent FMN reductase
MRRLQIIIVSTREGRVGQAVGRWFHEHAVRHAKFDVELIDLADVNLPLFDEPKHPRFRDYQHEHTKRWSETIERGDAYVFVTPEYNFSTPPALLNAVDYVLHEWAYKPAAFVSYGGVSGGLRGAQMAKLALTAVRVMPIPEIVPIPTFTQFIDKTTGVFQATEAHQKLATGMLNELLRWADALQTMRGPRDVEKA